MLIQCQPERRNLLWYPAEHIQNIHIQEKNGFSNLKLTFFDRCLEMLNFEFETGCGSGGRASCLSWEGRMLESRLLLAACRSVLGQNTEPQTAPDVLVSTLHGVWVYVWITVSHFGQNRLNALKCQFKVCPNTDKSYFITIKIYLEIRLFFQDCPVVTLFVGDFSSTTQIDWCKLTLFRYDTWTLCASLFSSDPGAAGAEGPGVPGADGGGSAAGEGSSGDAAAGEGGGEERQRHPAAPEAAEGGWTYPGGCCWLVLYIQSSSVFYHVYYHTASF